MNILNTRNYHKKIQYLISISTVFFVTYFCYLFSAIIAYKIVALILLMTVSVLAMLFDILPVLVAAILSALIWNFFFIPPLFTFHINNAEDVLMFFLYFFIALVNAVLTFKIRKEEKKVRDKEEKENTIKLYNTLLNSLSHELRTPISTIIAAVDMLRENNKKISITQQDDLLVEIDIASIRLNRQVENLLNMSRLETGILKPNFDWCDINELINNIIQKIIATNVHNIIFEPNEQLPLFKIDRGLLEQILQNIIHNAINYTPKNTTIKIKSFKKNDELLISIADDGSGISDIDAKFVFDKFYRIPNSKTGGSGLGLSIVKGYVEALKGNVTLTKNENGGATFVVSIPADLSYINNLKNE